MNQLHVVVACLNNTGVSLMEKGCYRQAMMTLNDAVSIMKNLTQSLESGGPNLEASDFLPLVRAAEQRLMHPTPVSHYSMNNLVHVISEFDDFAAVFGSVEALTKKTLLRQQGMEATPAIYLIKLDGEYCYSAFTSAVIMYNYGMAYHQLSKLDSSLPYCVNLIQAACNMFQLAFLSLQGGEEIRLSTSRSQVVAFCVLTQLVDLLPTPELQCQWCDMHASLTCMLSPFAKSTSTAPAA